MTREEKSNLLNELLEYEEKNDIGNLTRADRREFQQWVNEALDQEPILDKIRAEIAEPKNPSSDVDYDEGWEDAIKDCLRIIDKYKAERTDNE